MSTKAASVTAATAAIHAATTAVVTTTSTTTAAATAVTATTTAARRLTLSTKPKFRYLSAWFCPYAHRATIALEYHKRSIDYEWVEALGWYQKENKKKTEDLNHDPSATTTTTATSATPNTEETTAIVDNDDDNTKEWYYHWKADELKRVNPSALVPTLIPIIIVDVNRHQHNNSNNNNDTTTTTTSTSTTETVDETKAVYESLVTIEYIDMVAHQYQQSLVTVAHQQQEQEQAPNTSIATQTNRLLPYHDPYEFARCRIWVDKVNRDCCSPYYDVLVRQDPMERHHYFQKLLQGIAAFANELTKTNGPTFLSDGQVCIVDIALLPWAYRYYVLQHYCGPEFVIPKNDARYDAYHTWYDYMVSLPYVQSTVPDTAQYLDHIQKYANGTARSKVANAVRRGAPAHELDDHQDEYTPTTTDTTTTTQ